jgi:hypothetical protein
MRWLAHGNLTSAAVEAFRRHGHAVLTPCQLELGFDAPPAEVFATAARKQLEVITADKALVDALYGQRVAFGRTIVWLQLVGGDIEQDDAIDRLFQRYKRLSPGRMYTVTETRVKIRQLPGSG